MKRLHVLAMMLLAAFIAMQAATKAPVVCGEPFPDTEGKHINAHGGAIIKHKGKYYWYGEHRGNGTPGSKQLGVACYSSKNLKDWKNEGIVMPLTNKEGDLLEIGCTIERPKVVYNKKTGKFVMWFHHELKGRGYEAAMSGVAVADNPLGPFRHIRSGRVNPGIYPLNLEYANREKTWSDTLKWWTPEWRVAVTEGMMNIRDLDGGQMARDMTVFVDDNGKAYHVYSSESNLTIQIAELDDTRLLLPSPKPKLKMEFIGNSITCGYGTEETDPNKGFSYDTENHCLSYAYQTARNLDADVNVVSRSGIGIYRNYADPREGGSPNVMPKQYGNALLYNDSVKWDASQFQPDIICINLGTNDISLGQYEISLFEKAYSDFIDTLLDLYPRAQLVLLTGSMLQGKELDDVKGALNRLALKNERIHRFDMTPHNGELGYGADWHPSAAQSRKMAAELSDYIRKNIL